MAEAIFYNAINLLYDGDYRKIAKLRERSASWQDAWEGLREKTINPQKEYEALAAKGIALVLRDDLAYPALLCEIPQPPFGLYVRGTLPVGEFAIAIVGTRKATPSGVELAEQFAAELVRHQFIIVSGLAFGIDAAAHNGCLAAGGKTIAVLAHGLDAVYPRTHEPLAERILANGGALVSEYPLGAESLPYRFLERNRIVSGLSRGTLVIEAPEQSGSLATARFALDQNRDVFVIPGSVLHPNFRGSHELIRAGAELITKPEEILISFGIEGGHAATDSPLFASEEEKKIYATLLATGGADVDRIAELTHLHISDVNRALTLLLIKRAVKETGAGYSIN